MYVYTCTCPTSTRLFPTPDSVRLDDPWTTALWPWKTEQSRESEKSWLPAQHTVLHPAISMDSADVDMAVMVTAIATVVLYLKRTSVAPLHTLTRAIKSADFTLTQDRPACQAQGAVIMHAAITRSCSDLRRLAFLPNCCIPPALCDNVRVYSLLCVTTSARHHRNHDERWPWVRPLQVRDTVSKNSPEADWNALSTAIKPLSCSCHCSHAVVRR